MNIISMIMNNLSPALIGKLASSLGITSPIAQKAISAAVPAILASLVGKSAQSGGSKAIGDLLGQQDPGFLDNLSGILGGDKQAGIAEQGMGALGSLMGDTGVGALTGMLGKFAGTDKAATAGLLGMVAPAVLGTIGKHQRDNGLDANGLADLLAGQKDNITAAMPDGIASLLGGSGLLDSITPNLDSLKSAAGAAAGVAAGAAGAVAGAAGSAADSATSAAKSAASNVEGMADQAAAEVKSTNWLPWILGGLVLLGLAYWFTSGSTPKMTEMEMPKIEMPKVPEIMVDGNNVAGKFGEMFGTLGESLSGITDVESAKAALPKLQEAQSTIDQLGGLAGKLTGENKTGLVSFLSSSMAVIKPIVTTLMANESIGPVLKPVLEPLMASLEKIGA